MRAPIVRSHRPLARKLLSPLGGTVRGLDPLPVAPRRFLRRRLTAAAVRARLAGCADVEIAAITGSLGKTTTKDLLAHILATQGPTMKTRGNENGIYGLPSTLLMIRPDDRFAVVEAGIKAIPSEMGWMASMFRPSVAVLTSIGEDHLVYYGTQQALAAEKRRLLERLGTGGTAVVNADDRLARSAGDGLRARVLRAGWAPDADVRIRSASVSLEKGLRLEIDAFGERIEGRTGLYGKHLATAVALATAAASALGVAPATALAAARDFESPDGRLRPTPGPGGITWLLDDYKSRRPGQTAAIEALGSVSGRRRIAVLGELDEGLVEEGWSNAAELLPGRAELAVAVGDRTDLICSALAGSGVRCWGHERLEGATETLREVLEAGDVVLVNSGTRLHLRRIKVLLEGGPLGCRARRCIRPILCDRCPDLEGEPPVAVITER